MPPLQDRPAAPPDPPPVGPPADAITLGFAEMAAAIARLQHTLANPPTPLYRALILKVLV